MRRSLRFADPAAPVQSCEVAVGVVDDATTKAE